MSKKERKHRNVKQNSCPVAFPSLPSPAQQRREKEKARELRNSNWWRQKRGQGLCAYCEEIFPKEELTMDHIIPIARGGKSTKKNIVVSCKRCNHSKSYKLRGELILEESLRKKSE